MRLSSAWYREMRRAWSPPGVAAAAADAVAGAVAADSAVDAAAAGAVDAVAVAASVRGRRSVAVGVAASMARAREVNAVRDPRAPLLQRQKPHGVLT